MTYFGFSSSSRMQLFIGLAVLFLIGSISSVSATFIPSNGSVDTTFIPPTYGVGINPVTVQTDGKILIGLGTSGIGQKFARLQINGSLDNTFLSGGVVVANGPINAITVQSDDKILIGGGFTQYNYVNTTRVTRLNTDGTRDSSFVVSGLNSFTVYALAVQSDGKILVAGQNGNIRRLLANGAIDSSFTNPTIAGGTATFNGNNAINALAVQADGKILIGGNFTSVNGVTRRHVARLTSTGSLDTTFTTSFLQSFHFARTIMLDEDGKVLVGGYLPNGIYRLTSTGAIDSTFTRSVTTTDGNHVKSIAIQPDDMILFGGNYTPTTSKLLRVTTTGALDTSFSSWTGFHGVGINAIVLLPDGKVLVGHQNNPYLTRLGRGPDTSPPVVTLSGLATLSIAQHSSYTDAGAYRTDDRDGSGSTITGTRGATGSFAMSGTVNTAVLGTYYIQYMKSDNAGNLSNIATRTITVEDWAPPAANCDITTQYPPGAVPGWTCPSGWTLQGCPGSYFCVQVDDIAPLCTACGNGVVDPGEECDYLTDSSCNQSCEFNYCGDGEQLLTLYSGQVSRGWLASGATLSRAVITTPVVITQGQAGFDESLETGNPNGSKLGQSMTVLNDIDDDGFPELAVGAPGHDVSSVSNHGQLFSFSFSSFGQVDLMRKYFTGYTIGAQGYIADHLTSIGNIESLIYGSGVSPDHREFLFSSRENGLSGSLLSLFIGGFPIYRGINTGSVLLTTPTYSQIDDLISVNDLDTNGVDDLVVSYIESGVGKIKAVLLSGATSMTLSSQVTNLAVTNPTSVTLTPLGKKDGDTIDDILITTTAPSTVNPGETTIQLMSMLFNANGSEKSGTPFVHTIEVPTASHAVSAYGEDIDNDGTDDIVTVRGSIGQVILLNADWTIKAEFTVSLTALDSGFSAVSVNFLPDLDGDGLVTLAVGSPTSYDHKGAVYVFELQPPHGTYGGDLGGETCDPGKYCNDLTTRCEDDPSVCPGGPSTCQTRYIDGCSPICLLGCGDGVVTPNGLDGLSGTDDDEECDDANDLNIDACTNTCKVPFCGDSIFSSSEQCDSSATGGNLYGNCTDACVLSGTINAFCNMQIPVNLFHGVTELGAFNDILAANDLSLCFPQNIPFLLSGLQYSGDTRQRTCQGVGSGYSSQCSLPTWSCGDGVLDERQTGEDAEECDDGNILPGDGCDADCKREPILITENNQCTAGSYPQIEEGEYLPVWWFGELHSVGEANISCDDATQNILMRDSIMCQIEIRRGNPSTSTTEIVATTEVPCATIATEGAGLINGAITDFVPGEGVLSGLVGTYLFDPEVVTSWVQTGATPIYGQYQLVVTQMSMNYCALRRTASGGTSTGLVERDSLSPGYENCTNGADDNGDGMVDCADTLCGSAENCSANHCATSQDLCIQSCTVLSGSEVSDCQSDCYVTYTTCTTTPNTSNCSAHGAGAVGACTTATNPNCLATGSSALSACAWFYGVGHVPEQVPERSLGDTQYISEGEALCDAGFAVSKGYFVQQGFPFSEQVSTGFDTTSFTNIAGVALLAEGTAIDESLNQVATYQGAGKRYLFDEFITTRQPKAVNKIYPNGPIANAEQFLKVPTQHIYFRNGAGNTYNLTQGKLEDILEAAGVPFDQRATTPFTIVMPEAGQTLIIEGTVLGNGMYVSQGDIEFASTSCDESDVVEGLFVAGGTFTTDTINNKSLSQDERCKGGNLQIKGTLLGTQAGSALAPLRRSVLNAWNTGSDLLFDGSLVKEASDLFETCYLPNLLWKKMSIVDNSFVGNSYVTNSPTLPAEGSRLCMGSDQVQKVSYLESILLPTLLNQGIGASSIPSSPGVPLSINQKRAQRLLQVLPNNDQGYSACTIAGLIMSCDSSTSDDGTPIQVQFSGLPTSLNQGFVTAMLTANKFFPPRLLDGNWIDLQSEQEKKLLYELFAMSMQPIKQKFVNFAPIAKIQGNSVDQSPTLASTHLLNALSTIFAWDTETITVGTNTYTKTGLLDYLTTAGGYQIPGCDSTNTSPYCKVLSYPDFVWLAEQKVEGKAQGGARKSQIIDGSSVSLSAQPKIWTQLPPGAKSFLETLVILPGY